MRKALAILIMVGICSIYFIAMKNKGIQKDEQVNALAMIDNQMDQYIDEIIERIEKNYPETPKLLMEINNEIMEVQYSTEWVPESRLEEQTLIALRLLCSKELLSLNSYEKQKENLRTELVKNHSEDVYLKSSRIDSIKFLTPENAYVEVFYDTTKGIQKREYTLVKEEGLWKIYGWRDLSPEGEETTLEE